MALSPFGWIVAAVIGLIIGLVWLVVSGSWWQALIAFVVGSIGLVAAMFVFALASWAGSGSH